MLIPLGFLAASGGIEARWLALLSSTGTDIGYSITLDSNNNVFVAGASNAGGTNGSQFAKLNSSGSLEWQIRLNNFTNEAYKVNVDSTGNLYSVGRTFESGNNDGLLVKLNTSGTIQWQRKLGSAEAERFWGVSLDSSNNVYCSGFSSDSLLIAKYNDSGTIQWQRTLPTGTTDDPKIVVNGSGDSYISTSTIVSGWIWGFVTKYNTSGTIQWQKRLGVADFNSRFFGIAKNSSDDIYAVGLTDTSGSNDLILVKYNSSGTLQWQRRLRGANSDFGTSVSLDSSGNVYVIGDTLSSGAGSTDILIAKYNSSGTIQWQRTLGFSGSDQGRDIKIDSQGNINFIGNASVSSNNGFIFGKLPSDGSGTGTYSLSGSTLTYAASTFTDEALSLTDATPTYSSSTSSLTEAASTLITATSTLTYSLTNI